MYPGAQKTAVVGVGAVFTAPRAFQLVDHAIEELHAVVDDTGLEVQDFLRQGFRIAGWINSVALWA